MSGFFYFGIGIFQMAHNASRHFFGDCFVAIKGAAAVRRFLAGSGLSDVVEKPREPDMNVFHSGRAGIAYQKAVVKYIKMMEAPLSDAAAFHQFGDKERE